MIRKDWVETSLGEVAKYLNGRAFKPSEWEDIGLPIIRIQNLNKPEADYNRSSKVYDDRYLVKDGDLLFAWSASLDAYIWSGGDAWLNQHIFKIEQKKFIKKIYLYYYLKKIIRELYSKAHGSGMVHVTKKKFEATKIPLAPLSEQRAIVAKLEALFSELDNGIANLKTAQAQLKTYRQAVLKKAFEGEMTKEWRTQQTDLPSADQLLDQIKAERERHYQQQLADWEKAVANWETNGKEGKKPGKPRKMKELEPLTEEELEKHEIFPHGFFRLGQAIIDIQAGKSFRCEERPPSSNEIGVAKVSALSWGEYDENESKTCVDQNKVNRNYFIKQGDFLFSRANTIELVGACVIVRNPSLTIMLSDKTLRILFMYGLKKFYLYYLRCRYGRLEIEGKSTGNQDSMRNIGQNRIRNIVTPIYSLPEQHQIVQEIESRLSVCDQLEASIAESLEKAEALRQSILKQAFEGQLLTEAELATCRAEPDWEPAEALLERIRSEQKQGTAAAGRSAQVRPANNKKDKQGQMKMDI